MTALTGLFSFEGRARRSEWWLTNIGVALLAGVLLAVVSVSVSGGDFAVLTRGYAAPAAILVVNLIVGAAVVWIQTGVGVIVYQVLGYGWSYVPMVLQLTGLTPPFIPFGPAMLFALAVLYLICGLYFLVTLGFLDGEPTANAYGQSPKRLQSRNYAAPSIDP